MTYIQRLATPDDREAVASLWRFFAAERQKNDPSMHIKSDFDFERYGPSPFEWCKTSGPNALIRE